MSPAERNFTLPNKLYLLHILSYLPITMTEYIGIYFFVVVKYTVIKQAHGKSKCTTFINYDIKRVNPKLLLLLSSYVLVLALFKPYHKTLG